MWARALCTQRRTPRELRQHLNRLYQLVHPDRFAGDEQARTVNERSFQALQSALDAHFAPPSGGAATVPESKIVFFAAGDTPGDLRRASAHVTSARGSLASALASLFAQLALPPPPVAALGGLPTPDGAPRARASSLRVLAAAARAQAAEAAARRQREGAANAAAAAAAASADGEVLRLALQRAHGVRVEVAGSLPRGGASVLVGRLRDALRDAARAGAQLAGARVCVDGGFDARVLPDGDDTDVLLGACAGRRAWDEALTDEALAARCEARRTQERETRELERAAADAAGVRLMLHDVPPDMQTAYRKVLRELADGGPTDSRVDIAVMLVPGGETTGDAREGVLCVGLARGSEGVRAALVEEGMALAVRHANAVAREAAAERERAALKRALRVEDIRKADGVGEEEWAVCVKAMRERAERLRVLLHGARVLVVDGEASVKEGEIRLPWDFVDHMKV